MTEDFVSYSLAQAMKGVGFDEQVPYFYSLDHSDPPTPIIWKKPAPKGGLMKFNNTELSLIGEDISAPTLALAAKWLRAKGYHIMPSYSLAKGKWYFTVTKLNGGYFHTNYESHSFETYEEALETGITVVVNILKRIQE